MLKRTSYKIKALIEQLCKYADVIGDLEREAGFV